MRISGGSHKYSDHAGKRYCRDYVVPIWDNANLAILEYLIDLMHLD